MKHREILISTIALLALSRTAAGQTAEDAARTTLLQSAEKAHAAGDHKAALDFAQRAARIRRSPTLMLFIAEEQNELGNVVEAYASTQQCLREVELDTQARLRAETAQKCRALATQLQARVAHVVVNVPTPPPGISVKLSGHELNQAAIGIPYLITPGEVSIEATAPGHVPYRLAITVPEGKTVNVTVTLAPAPTAAAPPCPPGQRADGSGRCLPEGCRVGMTLTADGKGCCWPGQSWDGATQACQGRPRCPEGFEVAGTACVQRITPPPPPPDPDRPPRYGLYVGGLGAAVLATSGVIWLVANGRFNSLESDCGSAAGCEVSDRSRRIDQIKSGDRLALGTAIAGGALVATGAVLEWMMGRPPGETRVALDPVSRTLLVGGRF